MIESPSIGLVNTGVPLVLLLALGWFVQRMLEPANNVSHSLLATSVAVSALLCLIGGVVIFAAILSMNGADVAGAISASIGGTVLILLRLSAMTALIWAPFLLLVWFVKAQAVERRKGEQGAKGDHS